MTFECTGIAFIVAHLTCTAPETQVDAARFCRVAAPIRYSRQDTAETRRQIRAHNAAGVAACGWGRR
ncbi:hypothetical protein [Methylobacterium isbiliense]|jgi:hypothetical protein|uniref:Uncharacterized protein n=1 Tax=Methylobacterium isbiliense TaxID=315478 RepID=A0ABQ4S9W3_9HYPH|nr:hypothetical protein [Methylobacterium isbiliense]MDN3622707.1 hypothetical protein [Methylobacterium isbiliense]GJD99896.1 hypothetical protein GMJLKIPL_1814 [Methylobacterium isbiliense]